MEAIDGAVHGRTGGFALQQFGTAASGEQTVHYEVVPGSGTGELAGLTGAIRLTIDDDGTHLYELAYEL